MFVCSLSFLLSCFVASQISGDAGHLVRAADGTLQPELITSTSEKFKVKLQEPEAIKAFYRLHERAPGRGMDASMLIKKKALGNTGKLVAMVAAPVIVKCHIPQGQSKLKLLPYLTFKHNVIEMDENADVTFGVKEYPPWVSLTPSDALQLCAHSFS